MVKNEVWDWTFWMVAETLVMWIFDNTGCGFYWLEKISKNKIKIKKWCLIFFSKYQFFFLLPKKLLVFKKLKCFVIYIEQKKLYILNIILKVYFWKVYNLYTRTGLFKVYFW